MGRKLTGNDGSVSVAPPGTKVNFDASSVNTSTNLIHIPGHRFEEGDPVKLGQSESGVLFTVGGAVVEPDAEAGAIKSVTITNGGSGYTDGSYLDVELDGGSGTKAIADIDIASGNIVAVNFNESVSRGEGYSASDVLTVSDSRLGAGTGAAITVSSVFSGTPSRFFAWVDGDYVGLARNRVDATAGTLQPLAAVTGKGHVIEYYEPKNFAQVQSWSADINRAEIENTALASKTRIKTYQAGDNDLQGNITFMYDMNDPFAVRWYEAQFGRDVPTEVRLYIENTGNDATSSYLDGPIVLTSFQVGGERDTLSTSTSNFRFSEEPTIVIKGKEVNLDIAIAA